MRVVVCVLLTGAILVYGSLIISGGRPSFFVDPPSLVVVWVGTILFMVSSYSVNELRRWLALGSGVRQPIEVWEHRLAKRMCVVAAVATLALGLLNFLVGGVVLLMTLNDPVVIGPALAVMIMSPLYAVFIAGVVIAAMWAQITRREP